MYIQSGCVNGGWSRLDITLNTHDLYSSIHINSNEDTLDSLHYTDVPKIGSVIESAANIAISIISVIVTDALRTDITTDSLHRKYEYSYLQQ